MLEPPPGVDDADVLAEVRRAWDGDVDRVAYQQVGFGAHHWAAYVGAEPRLFVTYDEPQGPEAAADLEAAYAGAVALRDGGLEFVLAPLPAGIGRLTVPFARGCLSCSPWRDGTSGPPLDVSWTAAVLRRLHDAPPPPGLPRWRPKVGPDFAETTTRLTRQEWGPGPFADHRPRRRTRAARRRSSAGPSATTTSATSLAAVPGWPRTASRTTATSC